MEIANLFLGKATEDICSEGEIELTGQGRVRAQNLLEQDLIKDQGLVAIKCRKTQKYYIYAASD